VRKSPDAWIESIDIKTIKGAINLSILQRIFIGNIQANASFRWIRSGSDCFGAECTGCSSSKYTYGKLILLMNSNTKSSFLRRRV
jgi:hypothetical protein